MPNSKFAIEPPIEPMLAKLAETLPAEGPFLFEPKWDGFRALVFTRASDVFIQSRDLRPAATLAGVMGSMGFAYGGARLMTSPKFVNWLSQTTRMKPEQMRQHLNRLGLQAAQEKDPVQRDALERFISNYATELEQ